jgi:phosphotriesterase-related protein
MEKRVNERRGMVQTVRGLLAPDDLGVTMMHEHVFFDGAAYYVEPTDERAKALSREPVSLQNLWWARYNPFNSIDCLKFDDIDGAVEEARRLVDAGGSTLVDASPRVEWAVPPVETLAHVSEATGLHIVKGCGYYVDGTYPTDARVRTKTIDELTEDIVHDALIGVGGVSIRSGIIGEIGCSWPITATEHKVLRAAAEAQSETGLSITVHPGRNEGALGQIRDVLATCGADLSRVVLGHIDRCGYALDTRRDVLDSGCVLEYDFFGWEGHYPAGAALRDGTMPDMPNDLARVKEIKELVDLGYGEQVVVSHDVSTKVQRTQFGGWGFGHILRNVVPLILLYGISPEDLHTILVLTPTRLLTIV